MTQLMFQMMPHLTPQLKEAKPLMQRPLPNPSDPWWPCGVMTDLVKRNRCPHQQVVLAIAATAKAVRVVTNLVLATKQVAALTEEIGPTGVIDLSEQTEALA
jgi:hypothetical protein